MADPATLEGFIIAVRDAIESVARANADNRWWVLAPTLLVQRRDGIVGFLEVDPRLAGRPIGRALTSGEPRLILDALGARRCAAALHVDVQVDDELFAAIVLGVLTPMTSSIQYARVIRTEHGTPRLAAWEVGGMGESELYAALARTVAR